MSDKKNWGSTVLGWFVVREGEAKGGDPSAGVAQADGDPADAASTEGAEPPPPPSAVTSAVTFAGGAPAAPGGNVDFASVYQAAGLDEAGQGHVARAAELLKSLPSGIDAGAKKQIVEASLKAFGFPIEQIIESGVAEIQALEAYIQAGSAATTKANDDVTRKVAAFEDEIRRLRAGLDEKVSEQKAVVMACNAKKLEVQRVLEFFGQEAVARVVRESPRLIDPSAPAGS